MAVFIASNSIVSMKKRLAVNQAIMDAIGTREGAWRVWVAEDIEKTRWNVVVKGTNGFRWTLNFEGKDCSPSHVGLAVREAIEKADADLAIALSELVKEGVMFTREVLPDGGVEYVFDRVRLTGDVKNLRSRGALTRRGIQQYLVSRK